MFPELGKDAGQQKAYAQLSDETLFDKQWVRVEVQPEDLPGFKGPRVVCAQCGEGINFKREVVKDGRTFCRSCAGEKYYEALARHFPSECWISAIQHLFDAEPATAYAA